LAVAGRFSSQPPSNAQIARATSAVRKPLVKLVLETKTFLFMSVLLAAPILSLWARSKDRKVLVEPLSTREVLVSKKHD